MVFVGRRVQLDDTLNLQAEGREFNAQSTCVISAVRLGKKLYDESLNDVTLLKNMVILLKTKSSILAMWSCNDDDDHHENFTFL